MRPPSTRTKKDEQLKSHKASFEESRKTYSSAHLRDDYGVKVGSNRVIRLVQEEGLRARARTRFKCTTMSDHDQPVATNRLDSQTEHQRSKFRRSIAPPAVTS
jgi:putative transposase